MTTLKNFHLKIVSDHWTALTDLDEKLGKKKCAYKRYKHFEKV